METNTISQKKWEEICFVGGGEGVPEDAAKENRKDLNF